MNVQATHGLPAGDLRQLDGLRPKHSATENPALPLVPATQRELRWAFAIVIVSVLALAVAIPFARVPLLKITAFIPSYESAMAVCDLVTAVLLFGRVTRRRSRAFLALASGYLFNAVIVVVHVLTFPGVFSDTGLLGANDQTAAWLYIFWHGGFPLFVLAYALLPERDDASAYIRKHPGWAITCSSIGVLGVVAVLTLLATVGHHMLPTLIEAGN